MAQANRRRLTALLVAVPLVIGAVGLTALRAPGATVEGYGDSIGVDGHAPAAAFTAALKDFPVTVGEREFTASELGVSARELPTVPRAWSFGDWGRNYSASLTVDAEKESAALAQIEGYDAPREATVSYDGSWKATPSAPGLKISDDLAASLTSAIRAGKDSLKLDLQESQPVLTTETAQSAVDKLNGASLEVYGGETELATLEGAELASLIGVDSTDGSLKLTVNSEAVGKLAEGYSATLGQERIDGEQITGDDGTALKVIAPSQDGFAPGSAEEIAAGLSGSLATLLDGPQARVELAGQVDAAKPKTMNRTAVVDKSDHYAYFYENGTEVKRIPAAIGKAGHDTKTGTFKVYAQLTSQDMGSCTASGGYRAGGSFDYCTADVPWISYFNGDQGFHGTYWHSNFGNPTANMSHGCVNLSVADAQWSYQFLQVGSTVTVQD